MICMQVHSICIKNDGYVGCKSGFYTALDVIDGGKIYEFSQGLNFLYGDIDSGNWAVSYLLSMYEEKSRSFILSELPSVNVNGEDVPLTVQKTKKKPRRAFLPFVRNSIHKEFLEKSRKIW